MSMFEIWLSKFNRGFKFNSIQLTLTQLNDLYDRTVGADYDMGVMHITLKKLQKVWYKKNIIFTVRMISYVNLLQT